jgi:carboxyl-terminal processing protease
MRSLVIDLRGNPGGLLTAAVDLADKFVASGNIVATRGRSPQEDFDYRARTGGTWQMPLAVLIDGETASASEIFAGAVRDHHRGTVIGQRSYGKGSVQGIFPLTTVKAGVRLTTAKFYSPSGQPITNRGVFPDVVVQTVKKPAVAAAGADRKLQPEEDTVLAAALQFMRSRLTQRRPARQ